MTLFPSFLPPLPPSLGTEIAPKLKLLQAEFGDGYRQRAQDGLNARALTYALSWDMAAASEAAEIIRFFEDCGGVKAFVYTPPGETRQRRFVCQKWARKRIHHSFHSVTAEFTEVFDL